VPAPSIVAVTANAFEEDRANCLSAGMQGYLAKPFEATALEQVLEQVLAKVPSD
jgi:CheY-like chemotaxis protein